MKATYIGLREWGEQAAQRELVPASEVEAVLKDALGNAGARPSVTALLRKIKDHPPLDHSIKQQIREMQQKTMATQGKGWNSGVFDAIVQKSPYIVYGSLKRAEINAGEKEDCR